MEIIIFLAGFVCGLIIGAALVACWLLRDVHLGDP